MTRALRLLLAAFLVAVVASPAGALPRVQVEGPTVPGLLAEAPPRVSAAGWILYDDTYDLVLGESNADLPLPMASTTKIMTALLAYELGDPDEPVVVSERAAAVGEAEIGLVPGEVVPLGDLVKTLLIRSANDAAMAVAEELGGSVEGFVEMMNAKAAELGLENTSFTNPHGLDQVGHHSSARDLLTLSRAAMANPDFAAAAVTTRHELPPDPEGRPRVAEATNRLLEEYPGAIGVKTGFTFQAKLVLAAAAERDGRRIYAVVMGSEGERAHFRDAGALLDHGFGSFPLVPTVMAGVPYSRDSGNLLARAAAAEARVHLALAGLAGTGEPPPAAALGPEPEPELVAAEAAPPPGLGEALGWPIRYWSWLVGGG